MTIEEVRIKKARLSEDIATLFARFLEDTDLQVVTVDVQRILTCYHVLELKTQPKVRFAVTVNLEGI